MPTIEIKPNAKYGLDEVLNGISKLDTEQLEKFIDEILSMRAKRISSHLSPKESALLKKINQGLPLEAQKRMGLLDKKRLGNTMTADEQAEYLEIASEIENLNIVLVQSLEELAVVRGTSFQELISQLDIQPRAYG